MNTLLMNILLIIIFYYSNSGLCIHIKSVRNIILELEDWDENEDENGDEDDDNSDNPLNYAPEQPEDDVSQIMFDVEKLLVVTGGSVGVVSNNEPTSRFYCHVCNVTYCRHCAHLKLVKDDNILVQDFIATNDIEPKNTPRILRKAISTNRINNQGSLSAPLLVNLPRDEDGVIVCQDSFSCCGEDQTFTKSKHVNLYDKNYVYKCKVLTKLCTQCRSSQQYDGSEQGILNMGKFLMHHNLLRDYMYHFLIGNSCTLNGYYKILALSQENGGNSTFRKDLTYQDFKDAWYSFLDLLDISFAEGATCPECGEHPECVVCDATSLGHQKKFSALVLNDNSNETPTPKFSNYRDRLAISRKHTRKHLKKWISKQLSSSELDTFITEMESFHPEILKVMRWYEEEHLDSAVDILQCLYSSSPVCSYIFPSEEVAYLMADLFDPSIKSSVTKMRKLQQHCPLFFNLLKEFNGPCLPDEWKELVDSLITLAHVPFPDTEPVVTEKCDNLINHIGSFPNLPILRKRGVYQQDKQSKKKKKECRKNYSGHPNLTSGIFTLYCQHGICYGYQVMHKEESPDTPFTIFKTRFPIAPKMVVYDNCCALHAYCLNRDPEFFKDTLFLIDRFHWKNHRACSFGYCLAKYPAFKNLNSQINEQQNAATKKLKTQLSYMRPDNFVKHF
ncbi:uncharacterized protein [Clytia hemisphaerica]|uniref:uncharacterized protein n=1 Tax=Clytia hemisphaerica TaxID=252671 RepID=UPI0034D3B41B